MVITSALPRRAQHRLRRFAEYADLLDGEPAGDIVPFDDVIGPFTSDLQMPGTNLLGVDVERTGEGHVIEESYVIDRHGIVSVTITDLDSGYQQTNQIGLS